MNLTLFQLNDVHGYLNLHQEVFYGPTGPEYRRCGGYARIASLLSALREAYPESLLFDGGDTFHGTRPVVATQGDILPDILNELGIAAMTAHWDFAYGPAHLKTLTDRLNYPLLAANVFHLDTGALAYAPTQLFEVAGLRVGVVGLACPIVDKTMSAHFSTGLRFTDGAAELPGHVQRLRTEERADIIILLSHCGFPQDVALLEGCPSIDVCLSSHTHNRLYTPFVAGGALVIQSGSHGSFLGRLTLTIEEGQVTGHNHELHEISEDIVPDAALQARIDAALGPFVNLREVVGVTATALHRGTSVECPADDFLLASLRAVVPADLYFSNGWRYGAPIVPGPVQLQSRKSQGQPLASRVCARPAPGPGRNLHGRFHHLAGRAAPVWPQPPENRPARRGGHARVSEAAPPSGGAPARHVYRRISRFAPVSSLRT